MTKQDRIETLTASLTNAADEILALNDKELANLWMELCSSDISFSTAKRDVQAARPVAVKARAEQAARAAFNEKVDALSDGSIVVLDALIGAVADATAGEWGFMDEAYNMLDSEIFSTHSFAGYVNALSDFIDWSDDLSKDKGVECNDVQFAVTEEAYDYRDDVEARANEIKERGFKAAAKKAKKAAAPKAKKVRLADRVLALLGKEADLTMKQIAERLECPYRSLRGAMIYGASGSNFARCEENGTWTLAA